MNRMRSLFLLLLLAIAAEASAQQPDSLTPAQVREDLDFIARTIESMHPNPWHNLSRARFYRLKDSLAASVRHNVGSEDEYPLAAQLCAALNEGHTHAWPDPLVQKIVAGKIPVFPVLLRDASEAGFPVLADLSADSLLHPGDRIVAINGQPTAALVQRFLRFYGGLPTWRRSRMQNDLTVLLYASGLRPPYQVRYRRNGHEGSVTLAGMPYADFKPRRDRFRKSAPAAPTSAPWSFERLAGGEGLLQFNTMEGDADAFLRFLDSTFAAIGQEPVKGLVIDLRRNGGGNSLLGWYLLQFITDKPFRMSGDVYWKMSPEVRHWYAGLNPAQRSGRDSLKWAVYLAHADGDTIVLRGGEAERPDTNAHRYTGPVAVLIGPRTFSSANMTAATIADYHLATLVGEATGEPANDYGEVLYFTTPNAGVSFGSCTKLFSRPNGNRADNRPVLPNIPVNTVPGSAKDAALEAALHWLHTPAILPASR